jgi:uncharacterized protein (TIGR02466 family)
LNTLAKTTDLFAHTIYEVELDGYAAIQASLLDYITANFNSEFINEYTGHDHPLRAGAVTKIYDKFSYSKENKTIDDPNLKLIFDWITHHGNEYWKILNLSQHLNPYILQLWATGVKRGGFVASHNHNPVPVSGVFYLKAEPRLGNLFLENPLDLVLGKSPHHVDQRTPTRFNYEVQALSGKLVLFPGWMKHFTRPNPTDDLRMSMAVNFGCEGQVHFTEFS